MSLFEQFTLGDAIFIVVVTVGTSLIVYFANRGRRKGDKEQSG